MKKHLFHVLAASALISCMSFGMNHLTVSASINSSDFNEVESFSYTDSSDSGSDSSGSQASTLPAQFDLRSRGVVTPVKFQNPFGTCWAFGAIAASETSILSEMGKTYDQTHLDLSEKHLAWFAVQPLADEYSSQNGEGFYFHTAISDSARYNLGGTYFFASSLFSQGVGPVLESDYPYQGKNGVIERKVNSSGELFDYCYSAKDDWTIDSSERFQRKYRLEESILLKTALDVDKYKTSKEAVYDEKVLTAVKEQLYKGRGVAVTYAADTSKPDTAGNYTYLNTKNWCQYTDTVTEANHAVCIIGYNDNYPKENFNEAHRPSKDGAFLVKNSWGSGENTFPNNGGGNWGIEENGVHTGYFWLSYYDMGIEMYEAFDFDVNDHSDETEIIDQYDYSSYNGAETVETKKDCQMANVFTAQYNQKLTAVSCITSNPNTQVYYEVYLLKDGESDMTYGALVASEQEEYEYGGYHLKSLSKAVNLTKGQKYCITVKLVNENNKNEVIVPYLTYDSDGSIEEKSNYYANTIVNEGESLLKYNGQWYDWIAVQDAFDKKYAEHDADNFPIKGYSVLLDDTDISDRKVVLSQDSFVYDGLAKKPEVTIDGLTNGKDYTVSYYNNVSVGKGRVEIEGKGLFTGKIIKYFSIVDKADATTASPNVTTATQNATAATLPATAITKAGRAKKALTIYWKKQADVTGYEIQYSLKKSMKSAKTLTVKSSDTTKRKIKKLKAKRNYYVRIRTYKEVNGTKVYSAWSNIKKAKTK